MQTTDDPAMGGGDWFDQVGPPPAAASGGGSGAATPDQVSALYQQLLGRAPENDQVVQSWIQGTGGNLDAIKSGIAATDEGKAFAAKSSTASTSTGGAPKLNRNDPASVAAYVNYYASQPGANPSLKNDPNYWIGKISSGELGDDPNYIVSKFMLPEGAPAGSANPGATSPYQIQPGSVGFGGMPAPYVSNANAPSPYQPATWSGGAPPTAPSLTRYTLPTMAEAQADPGYQFGLDQGTKQINRSAAARGTVLNPGTVQALNRYGTDYATTKYNDVVNRGLAVTGANNNAAQTEFGDTFSNYQARYGQFSDANAYGQQGYTNSLNAYNSDNARTQGDYILNTTTQRNAGNDFWSHLNDLYQSGLSAANNSYKPSPQL